MEMECMIPRPEECEGSVEFRGLAQQTLNAAPYVPPGSDAVVILCGKHNGDFEDNHHWPWLDNQVDVRAYAIRLIQGYPLESDPAIYTEARLRDMSLGELYAFGVKAGWAAQEAARPTKERDAWKKLSGDALESLGRQAKRFR